MNLDLIHTNGGGALLEAVFKAISFVLYGDEPNGTFHALLRISLTIGAFCALYLAFFRQKFEPLIKSFFLPSIVIIGFLLVPSISIKIVDSSNSKQSENIKAPFFLAQFASLTSIAFKELTHLFKKAVGDQYPWVNNIHAEKNFFRHGHSPNKDELEENFQTFCHECAFRDLGMGLYNKKKFETTADLFDYLEKHASKNIQIPYNGTLVPCSEAIKNIHQTLKKEIRIEDFSADEIHQLLGQKESAIEIQELAKQKFAIDHIEEQIYGQKESPQSLGAQGTVLILSLRNFLEAVLYLAFPLVLLFSLFTLGIRTLLQWLRAVLWVGSWPIFYVAVDLFLNSIWNFHMKNTELAYSLETAHKFSNFLPQMEMIACIALASVPLISWILMKGGLSKLVHLASAIPIQTTSETRVESKVEEKPTAGSEDISRQTYDGHAMQQEIAVHPVLEENAFKTVVEQAKTEERMADLTRSLSSIQDAIKEIKPASSQPHPPSVLDIPSTVHVEELPEGSSRMHPPTHGSWSP